MCYKYYQFAYHDQYVTIISLVSPLSFSYYHSFSSFLQELQ